MGHATSHPLTLDRARGRRLALLVAAPAVVMALAARAPRPLRDDATTNDHREIAETGRPATVPGPLLRIPAGTRLHITMRNALTQRATVHGLHDHEGACDSVVLAPGEARELRFVARRAGTFAYFARTSVVPTLLGRRDDSQLVAAFIVDPAGTDPRTANARERLLVITAWDDSVRNPASPYGPRQVYAINGRSWPFTERLAYDEGDAVRWRVLDLSQHSHPMHLHGTYFRVESRGTPFTDTALGAASRLVVTEFLAPGETMRTEWKAERPGNWLFHCHTINHIDEALRLGDAAAGNAHADHGTTTDVMAGLVTAISVRPRATTAARPPPRRGVACGSSSRSARQRAAVRRRSPTCCSGAHASRRAIHSSCRAPRSCSGRASRPRSRW